MKIKHEHIESVLLAPQPKKGRRGSLTQLLKNICARGRRIALVPGKDWNNQQNIYHRWLKGETNAQREKFRN